MMQTAPDHRGEFRGVLVRPYWQIMPRTGATAMAEPCDGCQVIRLDPGPGFGTGTHATTQLCLTALGFLWRSGFAAETAIDFGSGSGILAVAAAMLGAHVEAIETEPRALAHGHKTALDNGLAERINFRTTLPEPARPADLIVANIQGGVLLEWARALCARLAPTGRLVLSGFVSTEVPAFVTRFGPLLPGMSPEVYQRDAWRAVVFSPAKR